MVVPSCKCNENKPPPCHMRIESVSHAQYMYCILYVTCNANGNAILLQLFLSIMPDYYLYHLEIDRDISMCSRGRSSMCCASLGRDPGIDA